MNRQKLHKEAQTGHTWEPYPSQTTAGGAHGLFTTAQTPGLVPDLIAFRGSMLRDRTDDVRAFVRGWFKSIDYWLANPAEGNRIIILRCYI